MLIQIYNRTNQNIFSYRPLFEQISESCENVLKLPKDLEISITFVRSRTIHQINKDYRKIDRPTDRSFPSGHTQASFIVATILMMAKRKFGIPALILAFLIGFSRLYLKVHFPTDVLGGMLMGIAIGLTVWFVYKWKFEKKFGPVIEPKTKPEKEK